MTAQKNAEKMQQKQQKEHELLMLNKLNENYLSELHENRMKKYHEQKSLSFQYEEFIKNREGKGKFDKHAEKNLEKSTLVAPTWIRDVFAERETYKKNMYACYYSVIIIAKLWQIM